MKKVFIVVLLLILFVAVAVPAGASPPKTLSFEVEITYPNFPSLSDPVGQWVTLPSSTLFSSSGEFDQVISHFGAGSPHGIPFQTAHVKEIIRDDQGTITISSQIKGVEWTFDGPTAHYEGSGRWVILSGTGAYENLHGQGSVTVVGDADFFVGVMTTTSNYDGKGHFNPK